MSNLNMNQNFSEELEAIVGGAASFLRGDISARELSNSSVGEFQGGVKGHTNLAAVSEIIRDCWASCTYRVSGC